MWKTPSRTPFVAGAMLAALAACARSPKSSSPKPNDSVEVGYGAQPKDKVTGSVTTIPEKDVPARPLSIEQLLKGRVPGLQIVQGPNGPSFRIRSTGTMLQDVEPLIVVDGIQIPSNQLTSALAGLTPKDIKQVNVLKDVASTSIYGGRGAGGVILIVTNR